MSRPYTWPNDYTIDYINIVKIVTYSNDYTIDHIHSQMTIQLTIYT